MKKTCSLVLAALLLSACSREDSGPAFPAPDTLPSIQLAEPGESTVPFGQPVDLHVRITTESPVEPIDPSAWLTPEVTLLDSETTKQQLDNRWQQDISLTVALYAVTNTPVFVSTPITESPELTLPFFALETTTRLTAQEENPTFGTGDPPDFRGPEALRRRKRNLWIGLGVFVLIAIGIGLLTRWFATRERPTPPPIPAHVKARRKLEALKTEAIWIQKDLDASAVALSAILRGYIEDRFGIQAPELTTEEFLLEVEANPPWPREQQAGLKEFFAAADRIKYAGDRPSGEILEELYAAVNQFVDTTREPEA